MIDADFVTAIRDLADEASPARTQEIHGRVYTDKALTEVAQPKIPEPATLVVHTLTGLADYIEANKDSLPLSDYALHVVDPGRVDLVSRAQGVYQQRFRYITAQNLDRFAGFRGFAFGSFMEPEDLIIALMALFEDGGDKATVLKILGNLDDEEVKTRQDDGVTQKATVRSGVTVRENVAIPNPVTLAPFRTFPDVGSQPQSAFVFRLQKGPRAALFEADGGGWKNTAIEKVAAWLRARVPDLTVIA